MPVRRYLKRLVEGKADMLFGAPIDIGLVLSDLSMPSDDRSGAIRHILGLDPCVRVMFMTGITGRTKAAGRVV